MYKLQNKESGIVTEHTKDQYDAIINNKFIAGKFRLLAKPRSEAPKPRAAKEAIKAGKK